MRLTRALALCGLLLPLAAPTALSAGEIHVAAEKGDVKTVTRLLEAGVDPDIKDERKEFKGSAPLHHAAFSGHADVASVLLEYGADLCLKIPAYGRTPLHLAALKARLEVLELLIANGADVNARDKRGDIPLGLALTLDGAFRRTAVVETLIASGANVNATFPPHSYTPLHVAVQYGRNDAALVLIENGADVNARNKKGNTPLQWAAAKGNAAIARRLIDEGAEVDIPERSSGATALHWASAFAQLAAAKVLIEGGADVQATDDLGKTPLHWAAAKGGKLTKRRKDPSFSPFFFPFFPVDQRKPVRIDRPEDYVEIVKLLIANGADVNAKDNKGRTPLGDAKKWKHREAVDVLQRHGGRK